MKIPKKLIQKIKTIQTPQGYKYRQAIAQAEAMQKIEKKIYDKLDTIETLDRIFKFKDNEEALFLKHNNDILKEATLDALKIIRDCKDEEDYNIPSGAELVKGEAKIFISNNDNSIN